MENVLTIFFSPERIYIACIEKTKEGLALKKIGTTSSTIDLDNLENPINETGLQEFYELMNEFDGNNNIVTVSIPMEYVLITQFPGRPNITIDEIMSVINIEIRQNYPQFNPKDFPTYLFQLEPRKEQTYFLAAIIPMNIFHNIKSLTNRINKIVQRIEISQISAHSAFLFNYPEEKENIVGIFNISDKFIDYSVIKNNEFYSYNLIKYNFQDQIPNLIENNLTKVKNELNLEINSLYFFGTNFNKPLLNKINTLLGKKFEKIKRLNPFRLMFTDLDDSSKQICSRLAHHFPACVGSILPDVQKRVKII